MPILTVFGGPNGSGKSSLIAKLEFEGRDNLLEADAIAKRINPADPRQAAVAAGREVILRTRGYLENLPAVLQRAHQAFVYENSGGGPRKVMETQAGVIVWRADSETAWVTRVREMISGAMPNPGLCRIYNVAARP